MAVITHFERVKTIDYLIRIKGTGTPKDLAKRLRVSLRTLQSIIQMMRTHLKAPIEYCRYKDTYYYSEKGGFIMDWQKS